MCVLGYAAGLSDYVTGLFRIMCSSVSDYVEVLCRIMWQFCFGLCGRSVSDYVAGLCWIM